MAKNTELALTNLSDDQLKDELVAVEREFVDLRFEHSAKGLPDPNVLTTTRRDIARVKTEIRTREIAVMTEEQLANRTKIRARRRK